MLSIGSVTFGDIGTPPRTPVNRSRRRVTRVEGAYNLDSIYTDFGKADGFLHMFQSVGQVGHLTTAQVRALETLEDAGGSFTVATDLLGDEGQTETFTAYFDTQSKPLYTPVAYDVTWYWIFQIPLYLT